MATEALDLPRTAAITIRLPYRLRVFLRARRIARVSRALSLFRQLADREERVLKDVGGRSGGDRRYNWLAAMVMVNTGSN